MSRQSVSPKSLQTRLMNPSAPKIFAERNLATQNSIQQIFLRLLKASSISRLASPQILLKISSSFLQLIIYVYEKS
jgi:hypothetical protein